MTPSSGNRRVPENRMVQQEQENLRLSQELERSQLLSVGMQKLLEVSARVIAAKTVADLVQTLTDGARELTGASMGFSAQGYEQGEFLLRAASSSPGESYTPPEGFHGLAPECIYQHLIRVGRTLRLSSEQVQAHPEWRPAQAEQAVLNGLLAASVLDANGRPSGLIMVADKVIGEFSEEDEAMLAQLAVLASLTLQQIETRRDAERQAAELMEERDRLRTLIDSLNDEVWFCDRSGQIVLVNQAAVQNLGMESQADLIGSVNQLNDGLEIYRPDGTRRPAQEAPLLLTLKGEPIRGEEMLIHSKTGAMYYREFSTSPIYSEGGQVLGAVGVTRDITEQKRTMQALHDTAERFRIALSGSPICVFTMDRDLRYTWTYNSRWGYPAEEMIGKRDDELPGAEDVTELIALKQRAIETGMSVQSETRTRVNGEWQSYSINIEPLRDENGEVIGLTAAAMETTHLRRLEKQQVENLAKIEVQQRLIRQREMERMEIARDLHDGPIQELSSMSMSLAEALIDVDEEERREALRSIQFSLQNSIREMRMICQELRPPTLAPFGLEKAIRSHVDLFRQRNPTLRVELDLAHDGRMIPEDARMALYRIYQELMNNTVKHARANNVTVRLQLAEKEAVLMVEDDGVGFRVPTDWVQLARAGHLGVVGMNERIEAAGGKLEIESQPGYGTKVRCSVPR